MPFRFWKQKKAEAQQSLERLQAEPDHEVLPGSDVPDGREFLLEVRAAPLRPEPGAALTCYNDGDSVSVGDAVDLCTALRSQTTTVVAIARGGEPVQTLDFEQTGEITLGPDVDLRDVYRSSYLLNGDVGIRGRFDCFRLKIHSAEQRGRDAYVIGPALGTVDPGTKVVVSPWEDPDHRISTVTDVVHPNGDTVGLILRRRDASRL